MGTILVGTACFYIGSTFFSPVNLHVFLNCQGNGTQSTSCYQADAIILNDSQLEQSPRLKEALTSAPLAKPDLSGEKVFVVQMSMSEFDSMNRMIFDTNQDIVNRHYGHGPNPTLALFPKGNSFVTAYYNSNSYQLIPQYPFLYPWGQAWA